MPVILLKPRLMRWEGNGITDHNRSELSINPDRIEKKQRMVDGTMRKYIVADKNTFNVSWKDLPGTSEHTVDGHWGAVDMWEFYKATPGEFDLEVTYGDGTTETFLVMFSDFSANLSKRGAYDMYEVSAAMEQV